MLRKASWTIGIVLLVAHLAAAQPPEPIPLPVKPPATLDGPAPAGAPLLNFDGSRPASLFYANADFLYWWVNHGPAPTLLTTAPNNGITPNGLTGGIIGQQGTTVLFDGSNLGYGSFVATRATAGVHLGDGFWSIEMGGFLLPKQSINYAISGRSDGTPLLTIPFLDAATGQQASLDISSQDAAFKPFLNGSIAIHSDLLVWGFETNAIAHSIRTAERSIDLLVGFRTLSLTENLTINQTVTPAQDDNITLQFPTAGNGARFYYSAVAGNPVRVFDSFGTRNQFYGPQVGGRYRWDLGRLTAELTGKVAVGVTHQQATIDGTSTASLAINPNTGNQVANLTTPGGVFALQNNIGSFSQNQFTIVPEIGFNLKWAVNSWINLRAGYSAIYWSNVARPGAQIDSVLNSKLVPTGALLPTNTVPVGAFIPGDEQGRPYFAFRDTAFWAQGVNFGVEFQY